MSKPRVSHRTNLIKTSKDDIDKVLDRFGSEQTINNPLMMLDPDKENQIENADFNYKQAKFYVDDAYTSLQDEWNLLFNRGNFVEQLKLCALDGNLGTRNFRSICWRIFWECLSGDKTYWVGEVGKTRRLYKEIRNKYVIDPYEQKQDIDLETHHPLSQNEDSIWHKYFQDNELRSTIMQDLDRLFPEIEFFQHASVKSIILHILFCYARENPQVSYKQGMHEILSPLIYVMITNSLAVKDSIDELSEDMKIIMDMEFIEHDAYILFCNMMESIEPWYTNLPNVEQKKQMPNDQRMFRNPVETQLVSAISKKLNRIQGYMLKRYDGALSEHLHKIDITPQLYGIRWVRLLFGREFSLNRLLVLWDAIFADGISLDLVDYIYLAMLMNLRGVLLQSDFNNCLTYLMKYPANTDTKYILKRAVALKQNKPKVSSQQHSGSYQSSPSQREKQPRPIHPVRNRLGETKQQRYAQALGSGTTQVHPHNPKRGENFTVSTHKTETSHFYANNTTVVDGASSAAGSGKSEFTESKLQHPDKQTRTASVASQISHLKTKVGSSSQIISRISNPLRAKMQHKQRGGGDTVNTIVEDHTRLQKQVSDLQNDLDKMQALCLYCGGKMDHYLSILQDRLLKQEKFSDEIGILGLAGLKQVRDIFKSGAEFRRSTLDYDIDFNDIDRHIEVASGGDLPQSEYSSEALPGAMPVAYLADFTYFEPHVSENLQETERKDAIGIVDTTNTPESKDAEQILKDDVLYSNYERAQEDKDCVATENDIERENDYRVSPLESCDVNSPLPKEKQQCDREINIDELDTVLENKDGEGNTSFHEHALDPLSAFQMDT